MNLSENGIYAVGQFIQLSREKRVDREKGVEMNVDYATITTGGRKGVFSVKFDPSSLSHEAFNALSNAALGDDIAIKLRLNAMNGAIYYSAEDVAPLPLALGN